MWLNGEKIDGCTITVSVSCLIIVVRMTFFVSNYQISFYFCKPLGWFVISTVNVNRDLTILFVFCILTHWGRVTHICVSILTITGLDNGLSPGRRQAIIWTNAGILLIGPIGTNFSGNLTEILTFSFTKMRLKVSSAKWRPFCLGLNVLSNGVPDHFQTMCLVMIKTFIPMI